VKRATTVSVIIPCYGQAHFLGEAIESVLAQSHPAEIVVVDDGSPDNTAEVVARYPQVRYVRQENKGLAEARNSGFRAAAGEYVMFLDADDRLTPNAIEAHLKCFAEHPDAQLVVGDIDHIAEDGSYLRSPRWPVLTANFYEQLLKVNHVANMIAVMARREVIATFGGFEPSCSPAEDYRLLLRAVRRFPSAHHRSVVAQYRRYPTSLSRKATVMLRALHDIMELEKPLVEGDPRLECARREGIRYWRDHFGRVGLREVYGQVARGELITAFATLVGLIWYARGRLLLVPWKYRQSITREIRERFRKQAEGKASS
jgi:glycosyltransferase involved in cell wall biosynthesis